MNSMSALIRPGVTVRWLLHDYQACGCVLGRHVEKDVVGSWWLVNVVTTCGVHAMWGNYAFEEREMLVDPLADALHERFA